MAKALVDRLSQLDSCAVSDALDRFGLRGAVIGIRPVWPCPRIAGQVVTIRLKPAGLDRPKQHLGATAINAAQAGDVLVVDNAGRVDVASWGGMLSLAAKTKRIQGVILDGACRDIDEIQEIGLPVYARGAVPVTARGRIMQESFNQEIQCGAVAVRPADLVIADGSGVVFIPGQKAENVIAEAEAIAQRQEAMTNAIRAGRPVVEVMESMAYESMLLPKEKS
ncbi:MAG: RraA family protein [Acidobacteria bacterium]|nr:RraA family protein [Acidobacteriota bacterium]